LSSAGWRWAGIVFRFLICDFRFAIFDLNDLSYRVAIFDLNDVSYQGQDPGFKARPFGVVSINPLEVKTPVHPIKIRQAGSSANSEVPGPGRLPFGGRALVE